MRQLLIEHFTLCNNGVCPDVLTEDEKRLVKDKGAMFLSGIVQRANVKNGNGRIYPKAVLEKEVENYQKLIREHRSIGELDHPEDEIVSLKNAAHMMVQLWWNGDDLWGKTKVLSTPNGQILHSLVDDGVVTGISSRALGSLTESKDGLIVGEDLQLICWDFVSEESTQGATMRLSESKKKFFAPNLITKSDRINRLLNEFVQKIGKQ